MAMYAEDSDTNNPEVHSRAWEDPFWANEGKAEIGCAFENQVSTFTTTINPSWPLVTQPFDDNTGMTKLT